MSDTIKGAIAGLAIAVILTLAAFAQTKAMAGDHHPIRVRWCPEDAVQVGRGDFDGERWESYRCIARDDLGGI